MNGKVVGESIQCPFHGWQFGGDGKCQHIPYCETIPARAKVQNWPTSEVNGEIYMWYHPTGAAPDKEVPVIPQIGDENWTEPRQVEFNIPVHIQDIAENSCDPEHFQYVHKQNQTPPSSVKVEDDGAVHLRSEIEAQGMIGELHATMFQPGLARVVTSYGPGAEMMVYNSAQPISKYDREGQVKTAIIAGRLLQDDARFLAKAGRDAPDVLKRFGNSHLGEQSVLVTAGEQGNSFSFL